MTTKTSALLTELDRCRSDAAAALNLIASGETGPASVLIDEAVRHLDTAHGDLQLLGLAVAPELDGQMALAIEGVA